MKPVGESNVPFAFKMNASGVKMLTSQRQRETYEYEYIHFITDYSI